MKYILTSGQAARIIGSNRVTLNRYINEGNLPAMRRGVRRDARIAVMDLREMAEKFGFEFDEEAAEHYLEQHRARWEPKEGS